MSCKGPAGFFRRRKLTTPKTRIVCTALLLGLSAFAAGAQTKGQLPPLPKGTPKVAEKAPDFTLPDMNGKPVKLSEIVKPASSKSAQDGQWALLVFYRGYW